MKTYWVTWEMWEKVYEHLGRPASGGTDAFLLSEYGLKASEDADPTDEEWLYEVTDEQLLTLFVLKWS